MKKRLAAFCLALTMVFSMGIMPVLADEVEENILYRSEEMPALMEEKEELSVLTQQQQWEILDIMPVAREFPGLAVVDDKIYVIGGDLIDNSQMIHITDVDIFDLNTKTWSKGAEVPFDTGYYFDAVVVNGMIYVADYNGRFYEYNPVKDNWKQLTRIPSVTLPGLITQIVAVEQKIYVLSEGVIRIYDVPTNRWSTLSTNKNVDRYVSAAVLDGKIYASGKGTTATDSFYIYDIETNSWSTGANMIEGKVFSSFVALNGRIYAIGGQAGKNTVESYDPNTDTWRIEPSTVSQRNASKAVGYNDKIYVAGARGEGEDTIEVLCVDEGNTIPPTPNRLYVLLNISESIQLSLSHNLGVNLDYDWSSTDETIATVNASGYVTAEGEGTCFIYAENDKGYSDYIPIKVIEGNADEIRLAVHLTVGSSAKLYLAEDPADVNWTSFDGNVVSVDDEGVLTAKGRGLAIVQGEIDGEEYHIYVRVNV